MGKLITVLIVATLAFAAPAAAADAPTWTQLAPSDISIARAGAAMTYDPHYGFITFGGTRDGSGSNTLLGGPLAWDGSTWTGVATGFGPQPPRRTNAALGYDPDTQQTVLYGGVLWAGWTMETWTLQDGAWKRHGAPVGSGCGKVGYDPRHHQFVLLTGGGMWKWSGKKWKPLAPATLPPDQCGGMLAYDGKHLIEFGGYDDADGVLDATWEWTGKTWVELHPSVSPPARTGASMGQTSTGLVLFGGRGVAPDYTMLGDTWAWDGKTWAQLEIAGPSARQAGAASDGQQLMIFGGTTDGNDFLGDTWAFQ